MARLSKSEKLKREQRLREMGGIILFGLALLCFAIIALPSRLTGQLGGVLKEVIFALFGTVSYLLPFLFIYLALELILAKELILSRKRQVLSLLLILSLMSLIAAFSLREEALIHQAMKGGEVKATEVLKALWSAPALEQIANQSRFWNGGFFASVLTLGLISIFGKVGAVLLVLVAVLIILLFLFNFSYIYFVRSGYQSIREKSRAFLDLREQLKEEKQRHEPFFEETKTREELPEFKAENKAAFDARVDEVTEQAVLAEGWDPEPLAANVRIKNEYREPESFRTEDLASRRLRSENLERSEYGGKSEELYYQLPEGDWRNRDYSQSSTVGDANSSSDISEQQKDARPKTEPLPGGAKAANSSDLAHENLRNAELSTSKKSAELKQSDVQKDSVVKEAESQEILERAKEIKALEESLQAEDARDTWIDRSAEEERLAHKANSFELYAAPPLKLLQAEEKIQQSPEQEEEIRLLGATLEKTLNDFGIDAKVVNYTSGPTISRFEIVPGPGIKVSRIVNLADDIALALAATAVRIEAPIPGKSAVGIEIPNKQTKAVLLRGILEDKRFKENKAPLLAAIGRDIQGEPIFCDLAKMPHLLIAGATGSGKSVCINSILISLLYRSGPENLRLLMIDPKVVELSVYNGIPHLLQPVVTNPKKATGVLRWAVDEMSRRYNLFATAGVRDFHSFNRWIGEGKRFDDPKLANEKLPYIVLIIDELSDLMASSANEVEESISRLTAMARAAGIHLIIATQRPSVDVITGVIKANIPSRIAFAVASQVDSRTILDLAGAEKLLGKGDMLYAPQSSAKSLRGQGSFVTDREVEAVVKYLKQNYGEQYDEAVGLAIDKADQGIAQGSTGAGDSDDYDDLLADAMQVCLDNNYASISLLQRRLNVGYPRAARMVDQLHDLGAIGPFEGSKPRTIVVKDIDEFRDKLNSLSGK